MALPVWLVAFTSFQLLISVLVILFNIMGIYLLNLPNTFQYNQKLCLIHLSVIKVLFLIAQNVPLFLSMYGVDRWTLECVWLIIMCTLVVPWCNMMLMLTVDRFIQALLHTSFATYINNKNTTKFIISLCWMVGAICLLASMFAKLKLKLNAVRMIHMYIIQVYHACIILTFVCTYAYIYYRYRADRRGLKSRYGSNILNAYKISIASNTSLRAANETASRGRSSSETQSGGKKERSANGTSRSARICSHRKISDTSDFRTKTRKHVMTFCIVVTYILFVMVPELLHYSMFHSREFVKVTTPMSLTSMVLFVFASFSECLLYIFMDKWTRERFLEVVSCQGKCRRKSENKKDMEIVQEIHQLIKNDTARL